MTPSSNFWIAVSTTCFGLALILTIATLGYMVDNWMKRRRRKIRLMREFPFLYGQLHNPEDK